MKTDSLALIGGIIAIISGYFLSPDYIANPIFEQKTMSVIQMVLYIGGAVATLWGGYSKAKNA